MRDFTWINSNVIAALISIIISSVLSYLFNRKKEWKLARELLLKRFEALYSTTINLAEKPCLNNIYEFSFNYRREVLFLQYTASCYFFQRYRILKMGNRLLAAYKAMLLKEEFETLLIQGSSVAEYQHFVGSIQKVIIDQYCKLVDSRQNNVW